MKFEIKGMAVELPFDLQATVYFRLRNRTLHGKIRRIKTQTYAKTGNKNVRIELHAVIYAGGREHEIEFGCFGQSEAAALMNTMPRVIAIHATSGASFPPKSRMWKSCWDGVWHP